MRAPLPHRLVAGLAALVLPLTAAACGDDDGDADPAPTSTTTTAPSSTTTEAVTTTTEPDPELVPLLLEADDLPDGFVAGDGVDDTVTTFCVGTDAAAGLRATARAVRGFGLAGGGQAVVQLVFRFTDDDAAAFVAQAEDAFEACHEFPGDAGLTFAYEPLAASVTEAVDGRVDAWAGRHGTSIGSERFTVQTVVAHRGDVGVLVSVLGVDLPRAELDALAATAFDAAIGRLAAG